MKCSNLKVMKMIFSGLNDGGYYIEVFLLDDDGSMMMHDVPGINLVLQCCAVKNSQRKVVQRQC